MTDSTSVSVGHGPGTPRNEGTAKDRGTPVPDSNLTEIDATQERRAEGGSQASTHGKDEGKQAADSKQTASK